MKLKLSPFVCVVLTWFLIGCSHKPQLAADSQPPRINQSESAQYPMAASAGYGEIHRDSKGRIINPLVAPTNQTYYFDLDSSMIHESDYPALKLQANYLASHPKAVVRLEGHTDDRGSREYNIALGWRRDQSIERILKQHGVTSSQIKEVSYGKERPAILGNNEYAWSLNRRVKLIYEVK